MPWGWIGVIPPAPLAKGGGFGVLLAKGGGFGVLLAKGGGFGVLIGEQ